LGLYKKLLVDAAFIFLGGIQQHFFLKIAVVAVATAVFIGFAAVVRKGAVTAVATANRSRCRFVE